MKLIGNALCRCFLVLNILTLDYGTDLVLALRLAIAYAPLAFKIPLVPNLLKVLLCGSLLR